MKREGAQAAKKSINAAISDKPGINESYESETYSVGKPSKIYELGWFIWQKTYAHFWIK